MRNCPVNMVSEWDACSGTAGAVAVVGTMNMIAADLSRHHFTSFTFGMRPALQQAKQT
jgi:hypothetical protein